eukprot:8637625-Prorocentrum_lima.AAC.1
MFCAATFPLFPAFAPTLHGGPAPQKCQLPGLQLLPRGALVRTAPRPSVAGHRPARCAAPPAVCGSERIIADTERARLP